MRMISARSMGFGPVRDDVRAGHRVTLRHLENEELKGWCGNDTDERQEHRGHPDAVRRAAVCSRRHLPFRDVVEAEGGVLDLQCRGVVAAGQGTGVEVLVIARRELLVHPGGISLIAVQNAHV